MTERASGAPVGVADRPLLLVAVRPSTCGFQALVWALREAAQRDAALLAVAVWPGDPSEPDQGRGAMRSAVEVMVRRAVEETGVRGRTTVDVVSGPVSLRDLAEGAGAELVVVGSEEVVS